MQRKILILLSVTFVVILADQLSKFWVLDTLTTALDSKPGVGGKLSGFYGSAPEPLGLERLHYPQKRSITVSTNFFRVRYAENPGAAWGMFRDQPENIRGPLFHLVSLGAVVLIVWFFFRLSGTDPAEKWALWGLPLVLGGALGNYIDRLARGFVIDFLEAHWMDRAYWPSFNVADAAICVGVGLLVIDAFVRKEKKPATEPRPAQPPVA